MSLLQKGNFELIDDEFLSESMGAFQALGDLQERYGRGDTDTFMNEVRDSIAARNLGFSHVNTNKHGFDARKTSLAGGFEFLEVKSASFSADTWGATFNDTNQEKADSFKQDNVYLCLALWRSASEPIFFAFGKNPKIGFFLEEKMKGRPSGSRSTQSISLQNLVTIYGFTVYSILQTPTELYGMFQIKKGCKKIPLTAIKPLAEFDQ